MTEQQLHTLRYLEHVAREEDATVACDEYDMSEDGALFVVMTRSVKWDHEQVAWYLERDGALDIL